MPWGENILAPRIYEGGGAARGGDGGSSLAPRIYEGGGITDR